jgi:hypothetical protein
MTQGMRYLRSTAHARHATLAQVRVAFLKVLVLRWTLCVAVYTLLLELLV